MDIVVLFYVLFVLYRSMYCLCVNVYVLLPPGDNPIAVNKYIIGLYHVANEYAYTVSGLCMPVRILWKSICIVLLRINWGPWKSFIRSVSAHFCFTDITSHFVGENKLSHHAARLLSYVSEARSRVDKNKWEFERMSGKALSASDLSSSDLIRAVSRTKN